MTRRKIIRQGPLPDVRKIAMPDKAAPIFQMKFQRLILQLVKVLTQVSPPRGDQPGWQSKYNVKVFSDLVLIKAPNGAGQPVTLEHLEHLNTASDWEGFARKLVAFINSEHDAVMEEQTRSPEYHALQKAGRA